MADRLSRLPDAELASALHDLGRQIAYPPTPQLARAVRNRLASRPVRRWFGWPPVASPRLSFALAALAVAVLVAAALAAFPGTRSAIAHFLELRGIVITHAPSPLPSLSPLPPGPLGERLGLGQQVALAEARAHARFQVLVPTRPGDPDEVYFQEPPQGGKVSLVYPARPGLPQTSETGVGMLITEFRGDLDPGFFGKMLGPETRLVEVRINGTPGYWLEGKPHFLFYKDPSGRFSQETLRLAGNTLLWEKDGVTLRIESALSKDEAIRIAESMR